MEEELLTVSQIAGRLGLTARAVRQWIHWGRLPATRVAGKYGREWRVAPADVEKLLAEREEAGRWTGEPPAASGTGTGRCLVGLPEQVQRLQAAVEECTRQVRALALPAGGGLSESAQEQATSAVAAIVRHLSELEQKVDEESRLRRREYQELQAGLQALLAALQAPPEAAEGEPAGTQSAAGRGLGSRARTWLRAPRR